MKLLLAKMFGMTCVLTGLAACGGGGSGASVVAPLPGNYAVVGTAVVAPSTFAVIGDSISGGYNAGSGWVSDPSQAWPAFAATIASRTITGGGAIGGGTELEMIPFVATIPSSVTTVIYAGGTNDIAHGYDAGLTQATLLARIDDMVSRIRAQVPMAQIIFLNVRRFPWAENPHTDAWTLAWNAHEASLGYPVVNIQDQHPEANLPGPNAWYPDAIHPSPQQIQVIAGLVAAALKP